MTSPWAHKLPPGLQTSSMDPKERFYRQFQTSVTGESSFDLPAIGDAIPLTRNSALQDQISQIGSFAAIGGERQDAIENVLSGISRLSNEVADAADFVPAYDQRTYSQAYPTHIPRGDMPALTAKQTIKSLTDQLNTVTASLAPKSRFQFKKRTTSHPAEPKPDARHMLSTGTDAPESITTASSPLTAEPATTEDPSTIPASTNPGSTDATPKEDDAIAPLPTHFKNYNEELSRPQSGIRKPSFSAARDIAITDHTGLHIILPPSAARATTAGRLTGLKRCIIDMSVPTLVNPDAKPFASLALRDIDQCLIVAGRVSGATHVTGVRNSVVVVAAGQVRIHECRNVDFYLWCGSHPIIEDCVGVRFAPVPEVYVSPTVLGKEQG